MNRKLFGGLALIMVLLAIGFSSGAFVQAAKVKPKRYQALLTQAGTNAPFPLHEFKNTFGIAPGFAYNDAGYYNLYFGDDPPTELRFARVLITPAHTVPRLCSARADDVFVFFRCWDADGVAVNGNMFYVDILLR